LNAVLVPKLGLGNEKKLTGGNESLRELPSGAAPCYPPLAIISAA